MPRCFDAESAECLIFTFKEGLLSPVAHDLRLRVARFAVEVTEAPANVRATFDAASLVVDVPMKNGHENPGALTPADMSKIAEQIREDVLHARRYPQVSFQSRTLAPRADGGYDFEGELELHGVTRPLAGSTRLHRGCQQVELALSQPDFRITPYRAMLGTLKIQSEVRVRLTLGKPHPAAG